MPPENVFDVCAILNADLHLGVPGGDAEILENLVGHDVISSDMCEVLRKMKGFRNIVVHRYGRINDAIAFSILQAHLDDFAAFREEIERFLGSVGE